MNSSMRSSQSSYGDSRYPSNMSINASDAPGPVPPLGKTLVDGYRDTLDPQHEDRSRYNPLNPDHPRSSALLNANDPVAMYMLTETAIGDSTNYEVLSLEEVEELKKEMTLLSIRIQGTKRKLTVETKLRDAAQSLGRLYSPPSPRSSGEYNTNGGSNSNRMSRGIFGRSGASEALEKSDSELAVSQRRCEELAQELWRLEKRSQTICQRLLEHTAGVLQMTHKGLKKGRKSPAPSTSDSTYDKFDDRSLYRTTENLDNFGLNGKTETNAAGVMNTEAMQATERRLEELSARMHDMMIQFNPGESIDPPPQLSEDGGPVNPTATVDAHLDYIKNNMDNIVLHRGDVPAPVASRDIVPEVEYAWKHQLTEINNRVQTIVDRFGLTRSPTLPPLPDASHGEGLEEQLSYLQAGVDGLESRVDGVLEQKSILTTQIQQQRELNSKSDAERDAQIGELTEQLTQVRKELEVSERENNANRDELALVMAQLNEMRHSGSSQEEAKATLVQAEGEVARLQSVITSLHSEADARTNEVSDARDAQDQAEAEIKRLEQYIDEVQRDNDTKAEELSDSRDRAEGEVKRLQAVIASLEIDTDAKSQEAREARDRAEDEVKRLEVVLSSLQNDNDTKTEEAREARDHAEDEVKRLEVIIASLQNDNATKSEEAREAREACNHAEDEVKRLEAVISSLQNDLDAKTEEAREAHAHAEDESKRLHIIIGSLQDEHGAKGEDVKEARDRAENEVQRLQSVIETLQNDSDSRSEEVRGARDRAEQEVAQLETAIQQIRIQSDARIKEADDQRAQSDQNVTRLQNELTELEGEIVRVTTELTMAKAELDGAYGSRAERAAEVASNPNVQRENDALVTRNIELTEELASLKSHRGGADLQQRADNLERELREIIDDYEAMTKASIEFEKERERFEIFIDTLRDRCEQLETQLAEERISWMNLSSPTSVGRDGASETTSTMVLKNEFKKMMRDTRNENMKILRAEQEERRRLEGLLRALRKEHAQVTGKPIPSPGGTPL
ncbi:hypothetical protein DTO027I6_362 [Penicillium roqueforti]|uniref:uncharacterized protein n=1 Tax=Penicillium roqueforti TaxID=5082 RepID=UPI00190E4AE7|nr:uncharacterized protein LCP9604111_3673 [Penicillium roqueforti]KAF9250157.1 hypothetical protein LCP9604111_3673 [Penicillium roqueforti]KAI2730604.1 hypothetical protein CBS147332_2456 [Penicillium roqueforti]KAI3109973.1 hypothetical protein CBS147331_5402 [Penicillium roqueforti]KAI3135319.1 hypothetical protein CBS147330_3371 [Penicillium roqueforti]KAI3158662.1 hypothetical protein CBS147317_4750 [Penicillium roqueforti]